MKKFKILLSLVIFSALVISMVACSASGPMDNGAAEVPEMESVGAVVGTEVNRKIVYTVNMTIESFDIAKVKNKISEKNQELGGYIESNNESYEDGECTGVDITFRIPTEKLDEFLSSVEGHGGVLKKRVNTTDITTEYVSAEARKNSLAERKRLLESLLDDEGVSASEKVSIISEISEVNSEIESIELMLKNYDSDVNYSTVSLTIKKAETFFEKLLPWILSIGGVALYIGIPVGAAIVIGRRNKQKNNK